VRALQTLQYRLRSGLSDIHAQRRQALFRVVAALLKGGMLWLSALGRFRCDPGQDKHGIKAVDRLLGNRALHRSRLQFYRALAAWILRTTRHPILLVDITEIRPGVCALTASLALSGRSLPLYGIVRRKKTISRRRTFIRFLDDLSSIMPHGVVPIVVTDAGFESPWFDEIERRAWHYVGRVRHLTRFLWRGEWVSAQALHRLATTRARTLGEVPFPRHKPSSRRLVISRKPLPKGRRRNNTCGRKGRTASDRRYRKSAREPWLLATSLSCKAAQVVELYAFRMQIEQNYRDTKSHRWGWQLSLSGSRSNARLEILLLIAALAMVAVLAVGAIAEHTQHHRRYQANTTRHRRVLSWFTLGVIIFQRKDPFLSSRNFGLGINQLRSFIRDFGQPP
jgi:Transposase DDE domain